MNGINTSSNKNNRVTVIKKYHPYRVVTGIVLAAVLICVFAFYTGAYYYGKNAARNFPAEATYTEPLRRPGCKCPLDRNLPIICINTCGHDINALPNNDNVFEGVRIRLWDKSPNSRAIIFLSEPGEYGYTCTCGAEEPAFTREVSIHVRGQSTLSLEKGQYTITFEDGELNKEPVSLLGMPAHSKWVLNASYIDSSLIRNALAFTMAGQVMEYAPRFRYCEVLIGDGITPITFENNYMGVYILEESIKRGAGRVNIKKPDPKINDFSFMIALDKIKNGDDVFKTDWSVFSEDFFIGDDGMMRVSPKYKITYPSAGITPEYRTRIINYINRFEYAINSTSFDISGEYRNYIDVNSFIQMAMLNEIFKNLDGGVASANFYKDIGGKMKAGPIWDFDLTLGNDRILYDDWKDPYGFYMINTTWFSRLFQDKYFSDKYEKIYKRLRKGIWSGDNIEALIDNLITELGPAAKRNSGRWYNNPDSDYYISRQYKSLPEYDYQNEINDIKQFIRTRMEWIDRNIHLIYRLKKTVL